MCTYKYQSSTQTCVYWWWSSVKGLGQDNRENVVEAFRNYVWLRYNICLCFEIHASDSSIPLQVAIFVTCWH